jgi:hypothetical protein
MTQPNAFSQFPDIAGRFGEFGGRYVAETLMPNILALEEAYERYKTDADFIAEFDLFSRDFVGRPSPLYFAERLTEEFGGAQIWFKRDELNHTGAHKINNCLGQVLLAKRMGKTRIIAETGAGPARRGDRDGRRALRPALRGLHGRHRCGAPGAQRLPHEAPGRGGPRGHLRLAAR